MQLIILFTLFILCFKINEQLTGIKLLDYSGSPLNPVHLSSGKILVFVSNNIAFHYDKLKNFVTQTSAFSPYFGNTEYSLSQLGNGNLVLVCSGKPIQIFSTTGGFIYEQTDITPPFGSLSFCNVYPSIEPDVFYISYSLIVNQQSYIDKLSFDGTNFNHESHGSYSTHYPTNFICVSFINEDFLYCLVSDDLNDIYEFCLKNSNGNIDGSKIINDYDGNTHKYHIFQGDGTAAIVFFIINNSELVGYRREKDFDTNSWNAKTRINIRTDIDSQYYTNISGSILGTSIFLYCLSSNNNFHIEKLNSKTLQPIPNSLFLIDSSNGKIISSIIGVFFPDIYTIMYTTNGNINWILYFYPSTCINKEYSLKINEELLIKCSDFIDPTELTPDLKIKFTLLSITPSTEVELSVIDTTIEYNLKTFQFTIKLLTSVMHHYSYMIYRDYTDNATPCDLKLIVCYDTCNTCSANGDSTNTNCLTCLSPNHLIENEPGNCVDLSSDDTYFLDTNDDTYKRCDNACKGCTAKVNGSNTNCILCNIDNNFYSHPTLITNCITTEVDGYYRDNVEKKFLPCYETCFQCNGEGSNNDHKCNLCTVEFIQDIEILTNCICDPTLSYYYYDANGDYTCTNSLSCPISHSIMIPRGTYIIECVQGIVGNEYPGYYYDTDDNLFKPCDAPCLKCKKKTPIDTTNCIIYNPGMFIFGYKGRKQPFDLSTVIIPFPSMTAMNVQFSSLPLSTLIQLKLGSNLIELSQSYNHNDLGIFGIDYTRQSVKFILSSNEMTTKELSIVIIICHKFCKTCSDIPPNDTNYQCTTCADNYNVDGLNPNLCVCTLLTPYDCFGTCIPQSTNIISHDYDDCISDLNDNILFLKDNHPVYQGINFKTNIFVIPRDENNDLLIDFKPCLNTLLLTYNPLIIAVYSIDYSPINKVVYYAFDQNGLILDITIIPKCNSLLPFYRDDIQNIVSSDDSSSHFQFIREELPNIIHLPDLTFHNYQSTDDVSNVILPNMTYIDESKCENDYKEYIEIQSVSDPLIYFVIDSLNLSIKSNYSLYSFIGDKLPKFKCDNIGLTVSISSSILNDTNKASYEEAKRFLQANPPINIFDPNDPFFNDICVLFPLDTSVDIPRKDRVNKYLQNNNTFCPDKCLVLKIDFESDEIICKCPRPPDKTNELTFQGMKENLLATLLTANYEVVLCYNLVFDAVIFLKNIGSWVLLGYCLLIFSNMIYSIADSMIFLDHNIWQLSQEIASKEQNSPIQKQITEKDNKTKKTQNKTNVRSNIKQNKPQVPKIIQKQPKISPIVIHSKSYLSNHSFGVLPVSKAKKQNKKKHEDNEEKNIKILEEPKIDWNGMEYDEAIDKDKRNIIQIYGNYVRIFHPIVNAFYPNKINYRNHNSVTIAKLFLGFMLELSLSSFFYSDQYISSNYNNDGNDDFIYNLPISIYSYLLTSLINFLIGLLSNAESRLEKLVELVLPPGELIKKIKSFKKCYKIKMFIFHILEVILVMGFWYYVAAFCAVYQNSQKELIISYATSILMGMIIPFGICLMFAVVRIICIKCKWKWLYCVLTSLIWFFG